MAFLCPVRIRNSSSGTRKKKQQATAEGSGSGGQGVKKRGFLSATVSSIINGDSESGTGSGGGGGGVNDNNNTTTGSSNSGTMPVGPGRITGSSSIETLVRVGLEKEAGIPPEARNMVVLHDFAPCVDDELEVRRGSVVSILYRENDWVYVILEQLPNGVCVNHEDGSSGASQEGFIPHSYCAPYGSPLAEMALCSSGNSAGGKAGRGGGDRSRDCGRPPDHQQQQVFAAQSTTHSPFDENSRSNSTVPFYKDPSPTRFIALYKFTAKDENDISISRGEILTVLNSSDPDWFYVVRSDGQEGFVPSAFVYPLAQQGLPGGGGGSSSSVNQQPTYQQIPEDDHEYADTHLPSSTSPGGGGQLGLMSGGSDTFNQSPSSASPTGGGAPSAAQQYGTELVMLYDYKAQAPDDLNVRRGDWVYADLLHQTVEGWLWAFAPKQRRYGFIPKAYARPPAMTSL